MNWLYPPILWGVGAAAIAWMGVLEADIVSAFFLGFIVGIVHDLLLYAYGVPQWRDRKIEEARSTVEDQS